MDGIACVYRTLGFIVASFVCCVAAIAQDNAKGNPRTNTVFISPHLEPTFFGATSLDVELAKASGEEARRATLVLYVPEAGGNQSATTVKIQRIRVRLEHAVTRQDNGATAEGEDGDLTYQVRGLPANLMKTGQSLRLKLDSAEAACESARLMLIESDGAPRRDISLARVESEGSTALESQANKKE